MFRREQKHEIQTLSILFVYKPLPLYKGLKLLGQGSLKTITSNKHTVVTVTTFKFLLQNIILLR